MASPKAQARLRRLIQKITLDSLQDRDDMRALQFIAPEAVEALDPRQRALRDAAALPTHQAPLWIKESLEWCHTVMRVEASRPINQTLNVIGSVTVNQITPTDWQKLASTVEHDTEEKRREFLAAQPKPEESGG
jgi:hypothetical protein